MIGNLDATQMLAWGIVLHLVVDWLFQNGWIAMNKSNPRHLAAWVHAGLHGLALLLIFPPLAAAGLGIAHLLVDTRRPLAWWDRVYQQVPAGDERGTHVAIWSDQVVHIGSIAIAALIVANV